MVLSRGLAWEPECSRAPISLETYATVQRSSLASVRQPQGRSLRRPLLGRAGSGHPPLSEDHLAGGAFGAETGTTSGYRSPRATLLSATRVRSRKLEPDRARGCIRWCFTCAMPPGWRRIATERRHRCRSLQRIAGLRKAGDATSRHFLSLRPSVNEDIGVLPSCALGPAGRKSPRAEGRRRACEGATCLPRGDYPRGTDGFEPARSPPMGSREAKCRRPIPPRFPGAAARRTRRALRVSTG